MSEGKARGRGEGWHRRGAALGCPLPAPIAPASWGLHWDAVGSCTGMLQGSSPGMLQESNTRMLWGSSTGDAPGPCAPTLPASKLPPCPLQLLLHGSSSPLPQHPPLPQAPAVPLHLKWAKRGQHRVLGMGQLREPPFAAQPELCPVPGRDAAQAGPAPGTVPAMSAQPRGAPHRGREVPAGRVNPTRRV